MKIKVIKCNLIYKDTIYKQDSILEIEDKYFRADCMESLENNEKNERIVPEETKETSFFDEYKIIDLKGFAAFKEIELTKKTKALIIKELIEKFNGIQEELEAEIKDWKETQND